jgi:putative membrane protein
MLGAAGLGVKVFFLCCILGAGVYGAASTRNRKILLIQSVPAAVALAVLLLS